MLHTIYEIVIYHNEVCSVNDGEYVHSHFGPWDVRDFRVERVSLFVRLSCLVKRLFHMLF